MDEIAQNGTQIDFRGLSIRRLATEVRAMKAKHGLSYREIALRCGMSRATLTRLLDGKNPDFRISQMVRIERALRRLQQDIDSIGA